MFKESGSEIGQEDGGREGAREWEREGKSPPSEDEAAHPMQALMRTAPERTLCSWHLSGVPWDAVNKKFQVEFFFFFLNQSIESWQNSQMNNTYTCHLVSPMVNILLHLQFESKLQIRYFPTQSFGLHSLLPYPRPLQQCTLCTSGFSQGWFCPPGDSWQSQVETFLAAGCTMRHVGCGILVPQPGIEPVPPAVGV